MDLFITEGRFAIVHCDPYCPDQSGIKQLPVTRNQCMVYKLPCCSSCWKNIKVYEELVYSPLRVT